MTENRYNSIANNLRQIREKIDNAAIKAGRAPGEISLMAVTKTQTAADVNAAIAHGITLLGENRAQELLAKYDDYNRQNAKIHFIGGLQTNKVRQIITRVNLIQSMDSEHLAAEIEKQAAKNALVMDVLIEVNIGRERSKSGILPEQLFEFSAKIAELEHLRLRGLMAIPPISDNITQTMGFFSAMQQLFVDIQAKNVDNKNIDILSMGMSDDFEYAILNGATLVRIGSALFGGRY